MAIHGELKTIAVRNPYGLSDAGPPSSDHCPASRFKRRAPTRSL
jgi:hypothetical protein